MLHLEAAERTLPNRCMTILRVRLRPMPLAIHCSMMQVKSCFTEFFPATLNTNLEHGIWRKRGNSVEVMSFRGSEVGGVAGATFTGLGNLAEVERIWPGCIWRCVCWPGFSALNNGGVWIDSNGISTLIARKGDPAPNLTNVQFGGISQPALNDSGEVSFYAF